MIWNAIPPNFLIDFLWGFVTNLLVGALSLLVGLAFGCSLAMLRLKGHAAGRLATGITQLFTTTPTFVAMFVFLNLLPNTITIGASVLAVPKSSFVILSLGIYAAAAISNGFLDAVRLYRAGSIRAALLFIPNTTRIFIVLLLASSTGAAIGVPEAVAVTLRHTGLLPNIGDRIVLVIIALVMFTLLVQAIEISIRLLTMLLAPRVLASLAIDDVAAGVFDVQVFRGLRYAIRYAWVGLIGFAVFALAIYGAPSPPQTVYIGTGAETGSWYRTAEKYRDIFASVGVDLRLVPFQDTDGIPSAVDGSLKDVTIGFAATETRPDDEGNLRSLGTIEYQPLFVIYRKALGPNLRIDDLRGRSIAMPPQGSVTVSMSIPMLEGLNITAANTNFSFMPLSEQVEAIKSGKVDAVAFMLRDDNPIVHDLLRREDLSLADFPQSKAISIYFKQFHPVKLPSDSIDLANHVPPKEISLVAGTSYIVVNKAVHPAVVWTMLGAMASVHRPATLVSATREFPALHNTSVKLDNRAEEYYATGIPWFYRRLPLWWASTIEYYLAIILPLAVLAPFYLWLGLPDLNGILQRIRSMLWLHTLNHIHSNVTQTGQWSRAHMDTYNMIRYSVLGSDTPSKVKDTIQKLEQHRAEGL